MNRAKDMAAELMAALRFLTTLPLPGYSEVYGSGAFPAAGLLIGACLLAIDGVLSIFPWELRNLLLVVAGVLLTGGLHYDGLADFLDGLGGKNRADRLRILSDSRVGTFGVLGLVLSVALRVAALMLLGSGERVVALLLAPTLARWVMVLVATNAPSARTIGLGAGFTASVGRAEGFSAAGMAIVTAALLAGFAGLGALLIALFVAVLIRWVSLRRCGGVTGDSLGASGEVTETLLLVFLASIGGAA